MATIGAGSLDESPSATRCAASSLLRPGQHTPHIGDPLSDRITRDDLLDRVLINDVRLGGVHARVDRGPRRDRADPMAVACLQTFGRKEPAEEELRGIRMRRTL